MTRFTGAQREDCGLHGLRGRGQNTAMATEGELRDSVQCSIEAAGAHKPFWMLYQVQGSDSWLGVGLFGTSEGEVYRFSFDSSPCGSDNCSGRLSVERCTTPSVARRMDIGPVEIRCATDR